MSTLITPPRSPKVGAHSQGARAAVPMRVRSPFAGMLQRKCACGGSAGIGGSCGECEQKRLQRKATGEASLQATNDSVHEREADAVAERVLAMRIPADVPDAPRYFAPLGTQRHRVDNSSELGDVPAPVESALSAPGRPLDPAARKYFEPRFGHNFGSVRIHVDNEATKSVQAHAFTVGHRIIFGEHQYRPGTETGRRLLAHELTHVVQQRGSLGNTEFNGAQGVNTTPAAAIGNDPPVGVRKTMKVGIARQPTTDPRHARGYAGEQGMGFELYSEKDGWTIIEGPSGSAGHGVTTSGFDGIAYNAKLDELHILDNKSLKAAGNVASATAIDPARNLGKNLDAAIGRVQAMRDTPNRIRVLQLLRAEKDALTNGTAFPSKVKLVVTGVGGQSSGVTQGLQTRGVQFRGANAPVPAANPAAAAPAAANSTAAVPNAADPVATDSNAPSVTPQNVTPSIKSPPTTVSRPALPGNSAATAQLEIEVQGAIGALETETRNSARVAGLVKGGVALLGGALEVMGAINTVNEALDMYTYGTVLGDAQQGAEKMRANAAIALTESQERWDAFPFLANVILEDKLESAKDVEGLDELSKSLGTLGDALDGPVSSLKSIAKDTRARANVANKLSDMLMKAAQLPQDSAQQASEFNLAQSLEKLGSALSIAASDYEHSLDFLSQLKGSADAISHKANQASWRITFEDLAQKLEERERQTQGKTKSTARPGQRAGTGNAHESPPGYLAPVPQAVREKQFNDAMMKPPDCHGNCHEPNKEPSLRDRMGDDFFKPDDKRMEEWLKNDKDDKDDSK